MNKHLAGLIAQKRAIVLCGAGGVGKTSVSAAVAISAARRGKRVLVVTIDPSRRLAELLGVSRNSPDPVPLADAITEEMGITPPGSLSAWMLDPKHVADGVIRRLTKTPEEAERFLQNRIYTHATAMLASMQEYTAVESIFHFVMEGKYDLVVLDTPPSRNALQFLEAPNKLKSFFDTKIFSLFLPGKSSRIRRAAQRLIYKIMDSSLGEETSHELQLFLNTFAEIFLHLNENAKKAGDFFRQSEVAFMLVTSPAKEALEEAYYFEHKARDEMQCQLEGYILNRSLAYRENTPSPELAQASAEDPIVRSALAKFATLARLEQQQAARDRSLQASLQERIGADRTVIVLPFLKEGVTDLKSLADLAAAL